MNTDSAVFLQTAIGLIFVSAAVAKAIYRVSLAPFLVATGMPPTAAAAASRIVPSLEGLLGLMLLAGVLTLPASVVATILSLGFCLVLMRAYGKGVGEGCRCFGPLDSSQLSLVPIARSLFLAGVTLLLSVVYARQGLVPTNLLWHQAPETITLGTAAGLGYVAVFALLGQVWSFEQRRIRPIPSPQADRP